MKYFLSEFSPQKWNKEDYLVGQEILAFCSEENS